MVAVRRTNIIGNRSKTVCVDAAELLGGLLHVPHHIIAALDPCHRTPHQTTPTPHHATPHHTTTLHHTTTAAATTTGKPIFNPQVTKKYLVTLSRKIRETHAVTLTLTLWTTSTPNPTRIPQSCPRIAAYGIAAESTSLQLDLSNSRSLRTAQTET